MHDIVPGLAKAVDSTVNYLCRYLAGIAHGVSSPDISWPEFARYETLLQGFLLSLLFLLLRESAALNFLPDTIQSMKHFTGHKIIHVNSLRKLTSTFFLSFFSFRSLFSMTGMFYFTKALIPSELRKLMKCGPEI